MAAAADKALPRQAAAPRAAQTPWKAEHPQALAPDNFQLRQPTAAGAADREPAQQVGKGEMARPTQAAATRSRPEAKGVAPAACKQVTKAAQARSRAAPAAALAPAAHPQ